MPAQGPASNFRNPSCPPRSLPLGMWKSSMFPPTCILYSAVFAVITQETTYCKNKVLSTMQILIVEDDAVLAMVSALALEEAGHTVVGIVHDMQSFHELPELNGTDLAVVDINLAGANEGLEVARRLHSHQIPVLFISGQLSAARENKLLALGLLRKPYEVEDLLDSVEYVYNSSSGSGAATQRPLALEIFASIENL